MTAWGQLRGHPVAWDGQHWRYCDTGTIAYADRPCSHCGLTPTPQGPDPCLGHLPGVRAACCGHGDPNQAYILFANGRRIEHFTPNGDRSGPDFR